MYVNRFDFMVPITTEAKRKRGIWFIIFNIQNEYKYEYIKMTLAMNTLFHSIIFIKLIILIIFG